jgi:hypothetical protein
MQGSNISTRACHRIRHQAPAGRAVALRPFRVLCYFAYARASKAIKTMPLRFICVSEINEAAL